MRQARASIYVCTICCAEKRDDEGLLPASERYQSPRIAEVLAEARASDRPALILSARFGLIGADEPIPWYDKRLTRDSAAALEPRVVEQLTRLGVRRLLFFARDRVTPGWEPYCSLLDRSCGEAGVDLSLRDYDLAEQLQELARIDRAARQRLAASGELFDDYSAEMEQLHCENGRLLSQVLEERGWPGQSQVGRRAAAAAWLVAQHAISMPEFQRRCLELVGEAVAQGEAPAGQEACLYDRICFNERRPQRFGTILDWQLDGDLGPWEIADPAGVEKRRRRAGLPPLAAAVEEARAEARRENEQGPASRAAFEARRLRIERWARRVGWLSLSPE